MNKIFDDIIGETISQLCIIFDNNKIDNYHYIRKIINDIKLALVDKILSNREAINIYYNIITYLFKASELKKDIDDNFLYDIFTVLFDCFDAIIHYAVKYENYEYAANIVKIKELKEYDINNEMFIDKLADDTL